MTGVLSSDFSAKELRTQTCNTITMRRSALPSSSGRIRLSRAISIFCLALPLWFSAAQTGFCTKPSITVSPPDRNAAFGSSTTFSPSVSGTTPLYYQWFFNSNVLTNATNSSLAINPVQGSNAGTYFFIVTNTSGSATSVVANLTVGNLATWAIAVPHQYDVPLSMTNPVFLAGGNNYSMGLKPDGTVLAWGTGTQTNVPTGLTNVTSIAAGYSHCVALRNDGSILIWGVTDPAVTNVPPSVTNSIAIAAGQYFTVALRNDGIVSVWGNVSTSAITNVPLGLNHVASVAAGNAHVLALRTDGSVAAFGANDYGQINLPNISPVTNIIAIAAGGNQSLALKADGSLVAWGSTATPPANLTNVVAIACGGSFCLALRNDGTIVGWGSNFNGDTIPPAWLTNSAFIATGNQHSLAIESPAAPIITTQPIDEIVTAGNPVILPARALASQPVSYQWLLNGFPIANATNASFSLSASQTSDSGAYSLMASNAWGSTTSRVAALTIRPQKSIAAWGLNGNGQTFAPTGLTNLAAIAGGTSHSLALMENGTITNWGTYSGKQYEPPNATNIISIAANYSCEAELRADGTAIMWTWFGIAGTFWAYYPQNYSAIALGDQFAVGVRGGAVSVWGNNPPTMEGSPFGVPLSALSDVTAVAAGESHVLALKNNGTVVAWGGNSFYAESAVPVGLTNVIAIAARNHHSLALRSDGTVVAWGDNAYGESSVPAGLTNVVAIAAGAAHSLALRSNGTIVTWGDDEFGQTDVPTGLTNVISIAAGDYDSLALVNDSAPCVSTQPRGLTTPPGTTASFQITASGTPPLNYQWQFNGTNIPGATNISITLSNLQPANAGNYVAVVSNTLGVTASQPGVLTIGPIIGWGSSTYGQSWVPPGVTNPIAVDGGWSHSLILKQDGTVMAVGSDFVGERDVPPALSSVTGIAAGLQASYALLDDGTVTEWGGNTYTGSPGVPVGLTNAVAIAAGGDCGLALRNDGTVAVFGVSSNTPGSLTNIPPNLTNVVAIAGGGFASYSEFALALTDHGTVVQWGASSNVPPGLSNVVAIATGGVNAAMALRGDGTTVQWSNGSVSPGPSNVVAIACSFFNLLALKSDGTVITWAGNANMPSGLANVRQIRAGSGILAITGDGSPYVTIPPYRRTVPAGGATTLTTMAVGTQPMNYQWQCNGTNILGATNASLTLSNLPLSAAGAYSCIVSNSLGSVASAAANVTISRSTVAFDASATGLQPTASGLQLTLTGLSGHGPSIIYASTNFTDWQPILTNAPTLGSVQFLDPDATNLADRFYRAVEQ